MGIKTRSTGYTAPDNGDIGWEDAPTDFTRRCVFMYIYGDTGTGRTSLALKAPGPMGLAHTAEKIDGVIQPFAGEKRIRMVNFGGVFSGTPEDIAEQANPIWDKLKRAWFDGIRPDGWARSMVLDTDTEAWEMLRLSRFGELNPRGRTDNLYGPVNAEWRSMFKAFRAQQRCNLISIGQTKEEYIDKMKDGKLTSVRTGRTVRAGQKEMAYMADVVVRTSRTDEGGFRATIEKGWFNAHSEGASFDDEEITFGSIMEIITGVDAAEWEE